MDILSTTAIIIVVLLTALASGAPVVFCLFGLSILFNFIYLGPQTLYMAYIALYGNLNQELFLSIPLFVLMATILESSGIASDLYETMHRWMGGLKGGLAMGTCLICSLIDAMSGLGATATITMAVLALPEMLKRGYNKQLAIGCIPCGGALGPLIPPSVIMILLGGLTGLSVGKLFMSGFLPGFLITFFYCVYIFIRCTLNPKMGPPLPREERGTWAEKLLSLKRVIPAILLIAVLMASIYSGACTPTEAAGLGAAGTFFIVIARRRLTWKVLTGALYTSMKVNGMVLWLLIGGTAFSAMLNSLGISNFLSDYLINISGSTLVVVAIMVIITLIMGCLMDAGAVLMILTPVFYPVARKLGMDLLWFSGVFVIALVMGYVTPPFGMNLFYMKGLVPADITMKDIWISVFPYTLMLLLGLILCMLFPRIITYLPSLMT